MRRLLAVAVVATLLPSVTLAASGDVLSGSGTNSLSATETQAALEALRNSLSPYDDLAAPAAHGLFSPADQRTFDLLMSRRQSARQTCRLRVRKASAQTRFSVLSGCVRDDLVAQSAWLASLKKSVASLVGTLPGAVHRTTTAITDENDAIDALLDGLDAHLYTSEADLQKARGRLTEKYVSPRWLSLTALRADIALSWTARLTRDVQASVADSDTLAPPTIDCLVQAAAHLRAAETGTTLADTRQALRQGLDALATCQTSLAGVE